MKICPFCERVMQTLSSAPPTFECTPCGLTYVIRFTVGNRTTALTPSADTSRHWGEIRTNVPQAFQDAFEGKVLEP
jgi:hypothetical protein